MTDKSPWLTPPEAADYARCSVKSVYRAAETGKLRVVRLSGRRKILTRAEWIDAWLLGEAPR